MEYLLRSGCFHISELEQDRKDSTMLVIAAFFLFLCALVCACMTLWGPAAACFVIAFIMMAAAGTPQQPPKRRISKHYW
jgi:hypothetical protein